VPNRDKYATATDDILHTLGGSLSGRS